MYTLRVRYYRGRWEPYRLNPGGPPEPFSSPETAMRHAVLLLKYRRAQAVQCLEGLRIRHWWLLSVAGELMDAKAVREERGHPLEPETLPPAEVPWLQTAPEELVDGPGAAPIRADD